jgi:predicted SAM-dependent methyltransferase
MGVHVSNVHPIAFPRQRTAKRRVLHVGCGAPSAHRLHPIFRQPDWEEVRIDIDEAVQPDFVCSSVDMSSIAPTGSADGVWSSHMIEHLYEHEVIPAFQEFHRVLHATGFLLLRCPDLESIAETLLQNGAEFVAYDSPAGPITAIDMLYGHRDSVARGRTYMAHRTGFTQERLGRLLTEAGFSEVRTTRSRTFDLWGLAFPIGTAPSGILDQLALTGLDFRGEA